MMIFICSLTNAHVFFFFVKEKWSMSNVCATEFFIFIVGLLFVFCFFLKANMYYRVPGDIWVNFEFLSTRNLQYTWFKLPSIKEVSHCFPNLFFCRLHSPPRRLTLQNGKVTYLLLLSQRRTCQRTLFRNLRTQS